MRPFDFGLDMGFGLSVDDDPSGPVLSDWLTRVAANGGTVSPSTSSAVLQFIKDCMAAGVWTKLHRTNLFAGDWLAAIVPLIVDGGFATDVPQGLMAPSDYTETGVLGGVAPYPTQTTGAPASKWFDTGWVPNDHLTAGDTHVGVYSSAIGAGEFRVPLGASVLGGGYTTIGMDGNPGDAYRVSIYLGNNDKITVANTLGGGGIQGHILGTLKSGVASCFINGSSYTPISAPIGTPDMATSNLFIGATCNPSNLSQYNTNCTIAGYHVGDGLTSAEALALSAAFINFQKSLGRWVHPLVGDWQRRCRQAFNNADWDSTILQALSDFAEDCDTAGLTAKILRSNLFLGVNTTQVRMPLHYGISVLPPNPGLATGVVSDLLQGHVFADYSLSGGWEKTVPANAVDAGTNGIIPQLVGGLAVWVKETPTQGTLVGWGDSTTPTEVWGIQATATTVKGIYGGLTAATDAAPVAGFFHVVRRSTTDLSLYSNGVLAGSSATLTTPTATPNVPYIEAINAIGAPWDDVNNWVRTCGYSIDLGMDATEAATYYSLWLAAMTAFGRLETYGLLTEAGDNIMTETTGKQLATEQA